MSGFLLWTPDAARARASPSHPSRSLRRRCASRSPCGDGRPSSSYWCCVCPRGRPCGMLVRVRVAGCPCGMPVGSALAPRRRPLCAAAALAGCRSGFARRRPPLRDAGRLRAVDPLARVDARNRALAASVRTVAAASDRTTVRRVAAAARSSARGVTESLATVCAPACPAPALDRLALGPDGACSRAAPLLHAPRSARVAARRSLVGVMRPRLQAGPAGLFAGLSARALLVSGWSDFALRLARLIRRAARCRCQDV